MTVHDEREEQAMEMVSQKLERAYAAYMKAEGKRLRALGRDLGEQARLYMDDAEFSMGLKDPGEEPSRPGVEVRMRDDKHMSLVERAGSGFQRVYLLSLLDLIARKKRGARRGERGRARQLRLIVIDEPELYQHPQRQRQILRNFIRIVEGDPLVRIVCSTHSPYFVELRRVDTLRLLRREEEGKRARFVTLDGLVGKMLGKEPTLPGAREELSTWLDMNATHWITEGFFASLVALVEGPGDRNMLLAAASVLAAGPGGRQGGRRRGGAKVAGPESADLDRREISVVPADGVGNMPKFMQLFGEFGIPVYPIWDLDRTNREEGEDTQERNEILAALASGTAHAGTPCETAINPGYACFRDNLTMSLAEDLCACGDLLDGDETYEGLKKARERDQEATHNRNRDRGTGDKQADPTEIRGGGGRDRLAKEVPEQQAKRVQDAQGCARKVPREVGKVCDRGGGAHARRPWQEAAARGRAPSQKPVSPEVETRQSTQMPPRVRHGTGQTDQ